MKKLITFACFLLVYITDFASVTGTLNQKDAERELSRLSTAKKSEDSIKILYNAFDLSNRNERVKIGYQLLDIANRTGNREVAVDMLNRLAIRVEDTEALGRLLEYSTNLPNDSARRGVELMIAMEQIKNEALTKDSSERNKNLITFAKISLEDNEDIYQEILDLYSAMVYLGLSSQGSLYLEYLTRLQELVKKLPKEDYAIRNLVFTTAAIYYTRKQDYSKALEASRELLKEVELLREQYSSDDRKYQNFDYFLYMVYRRMLENYKGMTPQEAEKLYSECVELAQRNEEVAQIFGKRGLTKSYYNMAIHNYKEAIPNIRMALSADSLSLFRRQELLGLLVEALDSIGDRPAHYEAMKQYINALTEERTRRQADANKELQLRTDINQMAFEERRENAKIQEAHKRMRKISITLVYVLAALLIYMCGAYLRMRQKVKILSQKNRGLARNLEQIFDDGTPVGTHDPRIKRGNLKG